MTSLLFAALASQIKTYVCVLLTAVLFDWLTCVIRFEPPFTVKAKRGRVWGWRGQNPPEVVRSLFAGSKCLKACNKNWPGAGVFRVDNLSFWFGN